MSVCSSLCYIQHYSMYRAQICYDSPMFVQQQYLWNVTLKPAVGCYDIWMKRRRSGCSLFGENPCEKELSWERYGYFCTFRGTHSDYRLKADTRFAPSQWETSLQSNVVSHWLCANRESALGWQSSTWTHHRPKKFVYFIQIHKYSYELPIACQFHLSMEVMIIWY